MNILRGFLFSFALIAALPVARAQNDALPPDNLGAAGNEEILVKELMQLDVVGDATLPPATSADGDLVRRDVPEVVAEAEFAELANQFLHHPVSRESLERLQRTVRLFLSANAEPYALVYLPEQDITAGRLRLVVRASRIDRVLVEGNHYFPADAYTRRLALHPGDDFSNLSIMLGLEQINRSDYRDATVKVRRGAAPGTSDIVIVTRERKPWEVHAGYSNTGTATTGEDRLSAGATWGAIFGTDQSLSVNWSSDPQAQYSRSLSGTYAVPVGGVRLSLFGAYSRTTARVAAPLKQQGTSWQAGLNYDRDLASTNQRYQHSLQVGFDFKASDNNLDYILPPFSFAITDNLTHVVQTRVSYTGTRRDARGYTRGSAQVVLSPGGLSSANHTSDFQGTRAFAKPEYAYATLDLFRDTRLGGPASKWNWTLRGSLQLSTANLLGSEQFSAGGAGTVRGYEEGASLGDNGLLLSQELLLPPFSPLGNRDQLRVFVFQDWSHAASHRKLPGETAQTLHSGGLGLRYQLRTNVSATLAQGWQFKSAPGAQPGDDSQRLHVSLSVSY